jgi:protein TonB
MSKSPTHFRFSLAAWRPSLRGLLMILGAFVLGLLLFFFLWMGQRGSTPAVPPTASTRNGPEFAPLPAPMPAEADGASGLEEPDEEALAERPRLVETPRPPPEAAPQPASPSASAPSMAAATMPVPISSPPPRYPSRAMRRNETGMVRVQVEVGVDGTPLSVSIAASSQSRDLDRAALDAVRKWRFRPAQRDGQAVAGTVVVPIEFRL